MLLARSAPEGEADEIAMNPDTDTRRSAVGGKADVPATWLGSPLLAMCGRLPVGKGFFDGDAELVGAAMCPAC